MDNKIFGAVNKLMKINRAHKSLIDSQVAEIGLHRTQHRILMYLAREGSLPSQKKLAERFEVSPASITGALKRLEQGGYIERTPGSDCRFNRVSVTEKGREIVERTREIFSAVDDSLFTGFSDEEMTVFTAYLERILQNMKGE